MHQSTSGMTGPSPTAPPVATTSGSGRLSRLLLFGLAMVAVIGGAAALPLWLWG